MPIDTSIYSLIKPVEMPSMLDSQQKAMSLSSLAMQNVKAQQDMQNSQKDQAYQEQERSRLAHLREAAAFGQTVQAVSGMPETQRAQVYPQLIQQKVKDGLLSPEKAEQVKDYDPSTYRAHLAAWTSSEEGINQALKQSEIAKNNDGIGFKRAELGIRNKEADAKIGEYGQKHAIALKDDLDPNKARGGNLAKSQGMINNADRVDALFQQFPDYNIPANQTAELANAVAAMIGGGSAQSQHQIDTMTPTTMKGDANKIASWLTGQPKGQEQQAFMKLLQETSRRERDVADGQVKNAQVQRLAAHKWLRQNDPGTYNEILHGYGIEPENIIEGKYVKNGKSGEMRVIGQNDGGIPGVNSANAGEANSSIKPDANDMAALDWLKTADPSSQAAFGVRAKLKKRGFLQ